MTAVTDEQGFKTQMQGKAATATDIRDAGLEAEDYDADVDEFQKFKYPTETLIARKCRPVRVYSYVHGHYRTPSTIRMIRATIEKYLLTVHNYAARLINKLNEKSKLKGSYTK